MQINIFEGYAIYSVRETKKGKTLTSLPLLESPTKENE